jgi:hypothetical protein
MASSTSGLYVQTSKAHGDPFTSCDLVTRHRSFSCIVGVMLTVSYVSLEDACVPRQPASFYKSGGSSQYSKVARCLVHVYPWT